MRLRRTELFGATAILGGAWVAFACSGGEDYPSYTVGGNSTGGVVNNSTGGTTGGVAPSTGGTLSTGGFPATGGSTTGGFATGGTTLGTGGTGGGSKATGGTTGSGGSKATGGSGGSKATGGSTGSGGSKATGGSTGSGGSKATGGSGGGATVAFSQVVAFIKSECSGCHAGGEAPNLNAQNPTTLYNTLTSVTVSRCGGNRLVTANDPSKSALLMVGTGKCGNLRMPVGCTDSNCYAPADLTMLTTWIQSGAKNP